MIAKSLSTILFIALVGNAYARSAKHGVSADKYFTLCHRSDPEINACLENAMKNAIETLIPDHREIGLPGLDPLAVPKMEIIQETGNSKIYALLSDVTMKGFGQMTIGKVHADLKNPAAMTLRLTVKLPLLEIESGMHMDGKLLGVPIEGTGESKINLTRPVFKITMKLETQEDKTLNIKALLMDMDIKSGTAKLTNIKSSNADVPDVSDFINRNFMSIFIALKDVADDAFGGLAKAVAGRVLKTFPADELFLD